MSFSEQVFRRIPEYTDQQARDLERAKQSSFAKIIRTFPTLSEPPTRQEIKQLSEIADAIDTFIDTQWDAKKCAGEQSAPDLSPEQELKLKETARDIMYDFAKAIAVGQKVETLYKSPYNGIFSSTKSQNVNLEQNKIPMPSRHLYKTHSNAFNLMDIYNNHITREALSKFKSFGFTDEQAYKNCGHLIKNILGIQRNVTGHYHDIYPQWVPSIPVEENIHDTLTYWEGLKAQLEKRNAALQQPGHAAGR